MPKTHKIFLSYSDQDRNWVDFMSSASKNNGTGCLYKFSLRSGKPVTNKVKQAIQKSDVLMVLLTQDEQFSSYVQQEISLAKTKGKLIIPVIKPGIQKKSISMLKDFDYICFDFNNPRKTLSSLLLYEQSLKKEKDNILFKVIESLILLALCIMGTKCENNFT